MRRLAFLAIFGATFLTAAPAALAHEGRAVNNKYNFVVGWGDEPAYAGFKNSVELILSGANHKPITDLGDTLKVEITTGTQKMTLPFEANFEVGEFGEPGDYRAWMVPTRPGTYSFHITGTINGDAIDQTFTSSDKTFDDIRSQSDVQFPAKDPTTGDLAQRLDRSTARVAAQAAKAKDDANSARTVGMIGIIVGALGLVAGGLALARKR
jgi:hypothetical protein